LSHVPRGSPAHSRKNFPGCCGSSASDTVWSSKSQSEQSYGLQRQMKNKALSRNKKPGFHTWNRGNTKITNMTWQPYFFTIYHFDVAYFDRTVHVYQALIERPPICEIWKKSYELGGNLLTRGMPSYKKVEQNFTFCDRTFYNKSKTGRFQTDVPCWTCGNPKLKLRTRGNSKQATWNLNLKVILIIYKIARPPTLWGSPTSTWCVL